MTNSVAGSKIQAATPVAGAGRASTFDRKEYAARLVRTFAKKGGLEKFKEEWMAQLVKDRTLHGSDMAVAVILLQHISRKDGYAFPGITSAEKGIAAKAGRCARTVMRSTSRIEEAGYLRVHRSRSGKKNNVNEYYFLLKSESLGSDSSSHQGSDSSSHQIVTPRVTRVVTPGVTLTSDLTPDVTSDSTSDVTPDSAKRGLAKRRGGVPGSENKGQEELCFRYFKREYGESYRDQVALAIEMVGSDATLQAIRSGISAHDEPEAILGRLVTA